MGKNLDNELAEAAGVDEDDASVAAEQRVEAQVANRGKKKSNTALLVMLLVMVGGIVALFIFGFKEASIYSMPMQQLVAERDKHLGRRVRIEGELVPGTLVKRDKPCEYRFRIRGGGKELAVRFPQCIIPDGFRGDVPGGVEVTVDGELLRDGHFEATNVLAKCSSKYDPEKHTLDGES